MSMSSPFRFRLVLRLALACAAVLFAATVLPFAEAQLPSVVAYGARVAVLNPTSSTSYNIGKVTRDAAGDVFYYQPTTNVIMEIPVSGPTQIVVPSTDPSLTNANAGFTPRLAADAAGNLFVAHYTYSYTNTMYEIPRNANGTYGTSVVIAIGFAAINNYFYQVVDLAVDSNDDIYAIFSGYGIAVITSNAANTNGTNPHFVVGSHAVPMTAVPGTIANDTSGNIFYADSTNVWEVTAASLASGNPTPAQIGSGMTTPKYVFTDPAGNVYVGNGSSADYVIVNSAAGLSTASPTYTLPTTIVGHSSYTYGTVDNQGNLYLNFSGSLEYYGVGKVFIAPSSPYYFGSPVAVGVSSSTTVPSGASFGLLFTSTVTLNGTTPFIVSAGGSIYGGTGAASTSVYTSTACTAGTTYTAGQTCTIEVGYQPRQPGAFTSAINVIGGSSATSTTLLATLYVNGIASGSAANVDTGAKTTIGTGYAAPTGIAIDNTGAMYVADSGANAVLKYAAGSTTSGTSVGTGLSSPSGTAIDAGGNLFIVDTGNNRVVYLPNNSGTLGTQAVLSTGSYTLSSPHGIGIDGFGNIYVADTGNSRVLLIPNPLVNSVGKVTTVGSGFTAPYGIAIDELNDVFVADKGANVVYKIPGGYATVTSTAATGPGSGIQVTVGSGFNAPTGVAVDASQTIYVADGGNSKVWKVPFTAGAYGTQVALFSEPSSGLAKPYGIALDLSGDLYFTDADLPAVYFVQRSAAAAGTASTLAFGSVAASATSTLSATLSNAGYVTALTESLSTSPASPYAVTTNGCSSASPLATGASCAVSVTFTGPSATDANQAGTMAFATSELNATNSPTTTVTLSGESTGAVSTVAITGDAAVTYGETETYMLTVKDAAGNLSAAANGTYTVSISGTATSSASVTVTNGTGNFFLPSLAVGTYSLAASVSSVAATPLSVSVAKAPLLATTGNVSKIFDQVNPAFTLAYSGFVNGDTSAVVTGTAPSISTTATRVSTPGTDPITVTGGSLTAANYTITDSPGTLTINGSAPQTILFPALPPFTHGTTVTLTATTTSGLPVSYTITGGTISGSVLTIGAAGTVTVTATQAGNSSYAVATPVTRSFTAQ